MKVLHLNTTDIVGGAARGAYWLHRALREQGVMSRVLVKNRAGDDPDVIDAARGFGNRVLFQAGNAVNYAFLRAYRGRADQPWTPSLTWTPVLRAIEREAPDLVHLHWVGSGFFPVGALAKLSVPVVWTLRDMWPFTGGCHYALDCDRFQQRCGACPQLGSTSQHDLSRAGWRMKRRAYSGSRPFAAVAISEWLRDAAHSSSLLGGHRVEVIPNGVFTDAFTPHERATARRLWGLPTDKRVVLFGAVQSTRDTRKGFALLVEALRVLRERGGGEDVVLVVFGASRPPVGLELPLPARWVGHLHDDLSLALLYSAADVMITPSTQEAFGKTLVEAMACGTPVVAFATGGPLDIIVHEKTGWLARCFDPSDLAAGISFCTASTRRQALGAAARARVERHFDIRVVARRYRALYEELLG